MVCCVEEPTISGIVPARMFLSIEEVHSTALGALIAGILQCRELPGIPECHMIESDGITEELITLVFI